MDLFVIDTAKDEDLLNVEAREEVVESDSNVEESEEEAETSELSKIRKNSESSVESEESKELEDEEVGETGPDREYDYCGIPSPSHDISSYIQEFLDELAIKEEKEKPKLSKKDQMVKNAFDNNTLNDIFKPLKKEAVKNEKFITTGIEFVKDLKTLGMSERQKKKLNKKEREKTKGNKWYNLAAPEMTDELKNELEVVRMRNALDPKRFYKRSENKKLPKYFEMGKVMDSPLDYHNTKNEKKRKAKSLVEELMDDTKFQDFQKKKFKEAEDHKKHTTYNKALKKMKKLKKNK